MLEVLARNWWAIALRGVLAIIFGIVALTWPGVTLALLIVLFGTYAIIDGMCAIAAAVTGANPQQRWWPLVLWGVLGIAAGLIAFVYPGLTALALLYVIAFWAIMRGVAEIVAAFSLRKVIENEWLLILAGVCSIAFGALLIVRPGQGILTVLWLVGVMSIAMGVLLLVLSFRLRSLKERFGHLRPA